MKPTTRTSERKAGRKPARAAEYLTRLECTCCGKHYDANTLQTVCIEDGKPLYARYDLDRIAATLTKEQLAQRKPNLWRYREFLPVREEANIVSLGEGFTPTLRVERLASVLGLKHLWVKDEALMPTGSFKARGMSVAVSRAVELGVKRVAVPSVGNAGGALAAYAARAGLEAYVFMPRDVPHANQIEVQEAGAHGFLVQGLITDCGAVVREGTLTMGWFDMSTLKEPYRVEGKKTMGFEIAEQFGWELPDVIIYPAGGGTGLVGMWKAFDELERLGWVTGKKPRMVCVQAEQCAPIVKAYQEGKPEAAPWKHAATIAAGIRVPAAVGDFLMLRVLRESEGAAVAVSDRELLDGVGLLARTEGIFACPEGGATVAALRRMVERGRLARDARVVLFNTGTGFKYLEAFEPKLATTAPGSWRQRPATDGGAGV
jgi:threonine synthase